jgi:prepilin signal peptidase PulO-like enzyme (type II secretory pathway)
LPYEDKQGYRPEKSKEYEIWILLTVLLFIIHILYTVDILPVFSLYIFTFTCGICYLDIRDSYELRGIFLAFKDKIL